MTRNLRHAMTLRHPVEAPLTPDTNPIEDPLTSTQTPENPLKSGVPNVNAMFDIRMTYDLVGVMDSESNAAGN